jgi:hypothetical protein
MGPAQGLQVEAEKAGALSIDDAFEPTNLVARS